MPKSHLKIVTRQLRAIVLHLGLDGGSGYDPPRGVLIVYPNAYVAAAYTEQIESWQHKGRV